MKKIGRKIANRKTCWPIKCLAWMDFWTPEEFYTRVKNTNDWPDRKSSKEDKWIIYTRRNTKDQHTKENQLFLNQRYSNKGIFLPARLVIQLKRLRLMFLMKGWEMITIVHYWGGWNRKYSSLCGVQFDNSYKCLWVIYPFSYQTHIWDFTWRK